MIEDLDGKVAATANIDKRVNQTQIDSGKTLDDKSMVDEKPTNSLLGSKTTDKVDHLITVEVKREAANSCSDTIERLPNLSIHSTMIVRQPLLNKSSTMLKNSGRSSSVPV